ncbi:filamentous haemagglutinin family protein [Comamonas sp. GB3 AK4-5]|uniref:filamentous haemagglutinin family protein n=1 Tax=Comamonas sp. GB3 AK4-5 TaxID=3231487 RepID=UPI00351F39C8
MAPIHSALHSTARSPRSKHTAGGWPRQLPLVEAMALALLGLASAPVAAQSATPVGSAWFATTSSINTARSSARAASLAGTEAARLRQQQAAQQTLQASVSNLERTAAAIAAQQAAQLAARQAASLASTSVPDGLVQGGLWDRDDDGQLLQWTGAERALQTVDDEGQTTVTIEQTGSKALLNWDSFNVGSHTSVDFLQNSSDAVLNRVVGSSASPSQILGSIHGDGTVMVLNQNGVVFTGSSQVNVRNLVVAAATITDAQFLDNGLYIDTNGTAPTFTAAQGDIVVEAGAQMSTAAAETSTADGGYVLLLGANVANAGQITTPGGQTVLAAGDSFYIRKGVGTDANFSSTTAGNEVSTSTVNNNGSSNGTVTQTGLITATTGDITLTGHEVVQAGVVVASTSVSKRGTVHLSNRVSDAGGTITLAQGATTAVLVTDSEDTAYDSQRDAALQDLDSSSPNLISGVFDNLSKVTDRSDLSRIEIVSGHTVEFQSGSLTLATGGEIVVSASLRTQVNDGALLDVSGAVGVPVTMESNNVAVNIQGNELRDSAGNRDSTDLNNSDVWVDRRSLVYVAASDDYDSERWYTAGGLLEVSGYLATNGHQAGEWMAQGGSVTFTGGDLVTQSGSSINISGGTLDVQSGYIYQTWLQGSDGRLYELSSAPGDLVYEGLYQGYALSSERWGQTLSFYNPLIGSSQRYEAGTTVGRDAGKLVVSTSNALLEGSVVSAVYQGDQQTEAPQAELDGYSQSQSAVARAGQLIVGLYAPVYEAETGALDYELSPLLDSVTLSEAVENMASDLALDEAVPTERQGRLLLDVGDVNGLGLGTLKIAAKAGIAVDSPLQVAAGGEIVLYAPAVEVAANLTARSGNIRLGNVLEQPDAGASIKTVQDTFIPLPAGLEGGVTVHADVTLDASGLVGDLREDGAEASVQAYVDGGTVSLRSTESVTLQAGSLIDVSSGTTVLADGSISGGTGGNVQLGSGLQGINAAAVLTLAGDIRGYGVEGGGTLQIESASAISIGADILATDGILVAGETTEAGLILLEDYEVKAGEILPVDYSYITDTTPAGEIAELGLRDGVSFILTEDWYPSEELISLLASNFMTRGNNTSWIINLLASESYYVNGVQFTLSDVTLTYDGSFRAKTKLGEPYQNFEYLPAGLKISIHTGSGKYFAGYEVEANVFPNGLPSVAVTHTVPAGSVSPVDLTLAAGTLISASTALSQQAVVAATTTLPTTLFQSGFSNYELRAYNGVLVADGSSLEVHMPVLQADSAWLLAASGLDGLLQPVLPDLYTENDEERTLSQRGGASLSLAAGTANEDFTTVEAGDSGKLSLGAGTSVLVDPGQSIALSSRGSLSVDGLLQAQGGSITLLGPMTATSETGLLEEGGGVGDGRANTRSITLGANAVLDASAASQVVYDLLGRPYGLLSDGGSIVIGGTLQESGSRALASDAFVRIAAGALVDASGGAALLDLDNTGSSSTVVSNGGSISIASASGLYLDGTLKAEAGGTGASGGSLTVALEAPNYLISAADSAVLAVRELLLVQSAAEEKDQNAASDALDYGHAMLGVDQVQAGGFSTLTLYSNGAVSFGGDMELSLERELRIYSGALTVADGVEPSILVALAAPYVLLAGIHDNGSLSIKYTRPSYQGGVSTLDSEATLSATADLIDIKGYVTLGLSATVNLVKEERAGFDQLNLVSSGDIRFVDAELIQNGGNSGYVTQLLSSGDMLLRAAQLYPATGVGARVLAGRASASAYDLEGLLLIERYDASAADPALPYSVYGSLTLGAATVVQDGVVRAPLGEIALGTNASDAVGLTTTLTLGDGSLSSVSASGLVYPYGGTSDGVSWTYDGLAPTLEGVGSEPRITLSASSVAVEDGAMLDLSGGGELTGAGFVSGRGGSTDARYTPLMQVGDEGFSLPGLDTNPIYAIVPGYASAYAPADSTGAVEPLIGQQITIAANDIPGLAAGTYTLLPSSYALLPGAFRVELNGSATGSQLSASAVALRNGSYAVTSLLSTAHTGIVSSLASPLIITPAEVLRTYSEYNETSYAAFITAQAELNGTVRALIPADAGTLLLRLPSSPASSLSFEGLADFSPDESQDGHGGTLTLLVQGSSLSDGAIEILADGAAPTTGFGGASVYAQDLNAIGASRMVIGGLLYSTYGVTSTGDNSNYLRINASLGTGSIVLREAAVLRAAEVLLIASSLTEAITIEPGAGINTLGQGSVPYDTSDGYYYMPGDRAMLAVSNGWLDMLAPVAASAPRTAGAGPISIGVCESDSGCSSGTTLYAEGTLAFATLDDFALDEAVSLGARNMLLSVGTVNVGSSASLAAVAAAGSLSSGLVFNQDLLDLLLQGNTAQGVPALEQLVLSASQSLNFFGDVSLDTTDAQTGESRLDQLVLSTLAIYGYGDADDVASITVDTLSWAGLDGEAPTPISGGRGSGSGSLVINTQVLTFGYGDNAQPSGVDAYTRTILGFANVTLNASEHITANQQGALAVYQSHSVGTDGTLLYQGGELTLVTPLLTGEGGSVNHISAGGSLQLLAPTTGAADAQAVVLNAAIETGAELQLTASSILIDTTVALPSGKLSATAEGDITLADGAYLDLSGRTIQMYDSSNYSWGGDVLLSSSAGHISQAPGSTIDVSAENNSAGLITITALAEGAGIVSLQGTLLGSASGDYDAGGSNVPYSAGGVEIHAQSLGSSGTLTEQFAALNAQLNQGGLTGKRSFQLKQGDLLIEDELQASEVDISLDAGALTVSGTIDASGEQVGSIRLAAAKGLTLTGTALLDAHSSALRVDSYGQIIASPNRATVELDAGTGRLVLEDGASIDLRHGTQSEGGDGANRGTLDLYAARLDGSGQAGTPQAATFGDVAIDASGEVNVLGAQSIAVYASYSYGDAPYGTDAAADGLPYQVITQAYLDSKNAEAASFVTNALQNTALLGTRLAGLYNSRYADVFHLRPAVEITSATSDGNMIVSGDLDLSGYRYTSLNASTPQTALYGSGEVGQLTLRAGGDLRIYGSINDGFAPPPARPDDEGWVLTSGLQSFAGDVVIPVAGITLAEGTVYPVGKTLNYAITASNVTLPSGTTLPLTITLGSALTLPEDTVLASDVLAANGSVLLAAGTLTGPGGLTLPAGARLQAGTTLPVAVKLASLTWPAGAALPVAMTQAVALTLPLGAVIPWGTNVVLAGGADYVDLRPQDANGDYITRSNWAVAEMLPAGSQSWSLRLVAGADTEAADSRLTGLHGGSLSLADTAYVVEKTEGSSAILLNLAGAQTLADAFGLPDGYGSVSELIGKTEAEIVALYGGLSWDDFEMPGFWDATAGHIVASGLTPQGANALEAAFGLPDGIDSSGGLVGQSEAEIVVLYGGLSWDDFEMPGFWDADSGNSLSLATTVSVKGMSLSVVRTGTGDLDIATAGDFAMKSPYGVYTAGTQTSLGDVSLDAAYNQARAPAVDGSVLGGNGSAYEALVSGSDSLYQAWYPDGGGNLWMAVGGDLTGDSWSTRFSGITASTNQTTASSSVSNWLWTQGTGSTQAVDTIPTAWWINFGSYTYTDDLYSSTSSWPTLTGFSGLGTLGGGNVSVRVGGDAGMVHAVSTGLATVNNAGRSEGIVLAVGSTGRVLEDGSLVLTGGGDLDLHIGGGWNSDADARLTVSGNSANAQTHELYGALVNLRGSMVVTAGQIGTIELDYGSSAQDSHEIRATDPYTSSRSLATGGLMLVEGDSTASISSRGDLVLGAVADAGLLDTDSFVAYSGEISGAAGVSWFSLWTDNTALSLLSAGGNLALVTAPSETTAGSNYAWDYASNSGWFLLPGNVSAVALLGSIYYGTSAANYNLNSKANDWNTGGLLLAPLGSGSIQLLAGDSIYGGGYAISSSGADTTSIATVGNPGFAGFDSDGTAVVSNTSEDFAMLDVDALPLFAFGANTVGSERGIADAGSEQSISRFYAVEGDIVGLRTGSVVVYVAGPRANETDYVALGAVAVRAGRDIVYTGTRTDENSSGDSDFINDWFSANTTGNLIVHTDATDVSVIEAGRNILYANFNIAGPGTLEISAGGNLVQNDVANLTSLGPVVTGDSRLGASIVVQAGATASASASNYAGFLAQYLDSSNLADATQALADQAGKVVKTYENELLEWLGERYGFSGSVEEGLTYFASLAPEQQRIFARLVYFAELREGGREYNDADSSRYGSYLRGRNAIASLFPTEDAEGQAISYAGDVLVYGDAGIHTNVGGDIQVLTPGGAQTYGVEGEAPAATAGLITQGQGDIQLYALDSILLGQSRIMTTFGGDILAWSAEGDINAGRGSKTTVVYTPPRRVYDNVGNVTLSPDVPSTGAGIATLAPIAEVPAGDVDLIAPLGTIDAGEAGIRVSGNINIAALQVVNAANIQVQGESVGIPLVATVNVNALSSASSSASSATQAAQEVMRQQQAAARQNQRSAVSVQILGFGNEAL